MSRDQWTAVDRYIVEQLVPDDPMLSAAQRASDDAGLPAISVSPNQGKLLHLLARMIGAKRILEIGTLGGYSTIWLARALPPDGKLITIEFEEKHARIAKENLARAGLSALVDQRLGKAIDVLPQLSGPFDLVFIDADKQSNADYFDWAVKLSRPGSVIIVDNVVRSGAIVDPKSTDSAVLGVRRFYEAVAKDNRVSATAMQTVGSKGYDGLAIAMVTAGDR